MTYTLSVPKPATSPFTQMAATLVATPMEPAWSDDAVPDKGLNRTERIRRLLKATARPVTAAEIAWDMETEFPNFGSHLVWLLLKYDIAKGRVLFSDGKYSWNRVYDTAEAKAIRDAVKLLRRNGFKVEKP